MISSHIFFVQEHEGALSFETDAWTSPNHKVYVAVMVTFKVNGVQYTMLLDLIEVVKSHSELNLAAAFAKILDDLGISDKVSCISNELKKFKLTELQRSSASPVTMPQIMIQ